MEARSPTLWPRRWLRYREISRILVRHGLGFLLEWTGPRLLRRRRPLPVPPTHHLRLALEELGPTFIKLGQVLSTRPDLLPPEWIAELSLLQDRVPPFPFEAARRCIEEELGRPVEHLFAHLEEEPLAAASLSQVHAARLPSGEEVVVKVQRPGIEATVTTDLDILRRLASLAEKRVPALRLYDPRGIVEEFAHTLRGELDFRREGHHADRFRRNFARQPLLYIPQVYWDDTTRRVLTLERIRGIKIDDLAALDAAGLDRQRIALNATQIVMQEVFEDGFFHADPHPGNFFVLQDGTIAAVDFGMVGRLSLPLRRELVRLFAVAVRLDSEAIVEQLLRMSLVEREVDRAGLQRDLERFLRRYVGRPLREMLAREIVEEGMRIAFRRRLRLPAELWLLGKMVGMLEGVGLQLDPTFDPFSIARPYAERFLRQTLSPGALGRQAGNWLEDWADLLLELPAGLPALATRLEEGSLTVGVEMRRLQGPLAVLDLLSIRLSLALLLATLTVVAALLLRPLVEPGVWWGWALLGGGSVALLSLLVALIASFRPR